MTTRRLYATPLALGPNRHPRDQVRDAESFCARYLKREFDKMGHYEHDSEYDDSLGLLITHLWRLSETFDPERNDCFANYARTIIPKRAYDVSVRRLLGRNGNRAHNHDWDPLDESTAGSGTRAPQSLEQSNPDPDRGSDDRRLLANRNRDRAWAAGYLGVGETSIAA